MSHRLSFALLATVLIAAAGCQESSTTSSSSTTETAGGTASTSTPAETTPPPATSTPTSDLMRTDKSMELATPGGGSARLLYSDLKVGDGSIAQTGQVAMVHYTGWLTDGTKFDSSLDRGQPLQFQLGGSSPMDVIEGWDQGVKGMRVGGKRKLVIPPDLGYGPRGAGGGVIPPNATLVFEIELLGLQ